MFSQMTLSTTRRVPTGYDVWITRGGSYPPGAVDFVGPLPRLPGIPGTVQVHTTTPITPTTPPVATTPPATTPIITTTPVSTVQKAGFDLSALFTKEGWPILGILAIGLLVASRSGGVDAPRRRMRRRGR